MSCPANWTSDSRPACKMLTDPEDSFVFSVLSADTKKLAQITTSNKAYEEFLRLALGKVRREP